MINSFNILFEEAAEETDDILRFGVVYMGDYLHINTSDMVTILIDVVALLFLAGMFLCTRIYRKRGRLCDRLFSVMLITDAAMAVFDALVSLFNQSAISFSGTLVKVFGTFLYVVLSVNMLLIVLYTISLLPEGESIVKKYYKVLSIPAAAMIVALLINVFGGFVFYIHQKAGNFSYEDLFDIYYTKDGSIFYDEDTGVGAFNHGDMYWLIFVELEIYALIMIVALWKINKVGVFILAINFGAWLFMKFSMPAVSIAPLALAIIYIDLLVLTMNQSFYILKEAEGD